MNKGLAPLPDDQIAPAGIVSLKMFRCKGETSETWAYVANVRIDDGRTVSIDCETQWGMGFGLYDSKNGRRWGLSPLRSRAACGEYARQHASDVILTAKKHASDERAVCLERSRRHFGLEYRWLCDCGREFYRKDHGYLGCESCRPTSLAALHARHGLSSPSVTASKQVAVPPSLPSELASILDEDDIPERLAAHAQRMQRQFPALKFTKKHAARALLVKALRLEETAEKEHHEGNRNR